MITGASKAEPARPPTRPDTGDPARLALARLAQRYLQFCIVGGSGVFVDMGVLWLLASPSGLEWNLTVSKSIAAEVALLSNFVWNDVWTFRDLAQRGWRARLGRLLKFNLICLAGIVLSVALLNLQVHRLGMNLYVANFLAIVAASVWNFVMNLRFGWKAAKGTAHLH